MAESKEELKESPDEGERGEQKSWLKNSAFKNVRSWHPVPFMANR